MSATALRNFMLGDPLLDWLDLYGEQRGFARDDTLPGYDPRTDFGRFLFAKGREFESAVVAHLAREAEVVRLEGNFPPGPELWVDARSPSPRTRAGAASVSPRGRGNMEETLALMRRGVEIISHGLVIDEATRTFGEPDLLVRSDVLARLFPDELDRGEVAVPAPALGGDPWHYRVVDIKFTTLRLSAAGKLAGAGSAPAYRAQVYVYNRALGRMQGYEPSTAYVLGRSWEQQVRGVTVRGASCLEQLGHVDQRDPKLARQVGAGSAWVRQVRREGAAWQALPQPSVPELWPNLSSTEDSPWHYAKRQIAEALEDVTLLWGVGPKGRALAHRLGVYSWRDPRCTPAVVGLSGEKRVSTLQALLEVNQRAGGLVVAPARIRAAESEWRKTPPLEFYVDFETVGDLSDDFTALPLRGGEPLIFMIGCGHVEAGEWQFASFVAKRLTLEAEALIVDQWFAHMDAVRQRVVGSSSAPIGGEAAFLSQDREPRVIHWSPAEQVTLETAYNSAARRHPERTWRRPRWFDFLGRVMRAEPVAVRGALSFGLKPIARALYGHGLIDTHWDEGIADGLAAAVGAWWCDTEARRLGVPLSQIDLMQQIARYNEIDCKVMMEIVRYLRTNH